MRGCSATDAVFNVPGQMIELEVDLWGAAYVVKAGHQAMPHVSSSTSVASTAT
jgi:hypothetical protein